MAFNEAEVVPDEAASGEVRAMITRYNARHLLVARRMFYRLMVVVVPVVIVAAVAIGIIVASGPGPLVYGLIVFCVAVFYFGGTLAVSPSRQFQRDVRKELLPAAFDFVDEFSCRFRSDPDFIKTFPIDYLVQRVGTRHSFMLSGVYRDMPFTLTETEFADKGEDSEILFKGMVLQFALASHFPGTLLATPQDFSKRRAAWHFLHRHSLLITRSGNKQADHRHEFRTDAPQALGPLMEGSFPEALYYIRQTWPDDGVRLVLFRGQGFLLLPAEKNIFKLPGIDQSIDYDKHLRPMIRELQSLLTAANLIRSTAVFKQEAFS